MKNNHSYAALFDDIRAGRTDLLKEHHNSQRQRYANRDLNERNSHGQNLLMVALEAKNQPAIDMMFKYLMRSQTGKKDNQGNSILHYAYAAGNQKFVERLLEYGRVTEESLQRSNKAGLRPADVVGTQTPFITQKPEAAVDSTLVTPAVSIPVLSDNPQPVRSVP